MNRVRSSTMDGKAVFENPKGLRLVTKSNLNDVLRAEEKTVQIVKKSVASVGMGVVREGVCEATTGRVIPFVPRAGVVAKVWAVADACAAEEPKPVEENVAFYRKYTEGLIRRYLKMSMEAGRVPSLLGKEMFRGNVTRYKVSSFEDVVIFCHDIEKCLAMLDRTEQMLVKKVTMQAYSQAEVAGVLGVPHRTCVRMYARALDRLTTVLMEHELLKPQEWMR